MTLHEIATMFFLFVIPAFLMLTAIEAEQVARVRVPARPRPRRRPF